MHNMKYSGEEAVSGVSLAQHPHGILLDWTCTALHCTAMYVEHSRSTRGAVIEWERWRVRRLPGQQPPLQTLQTLRNQRPSLGVVGRVNLRLH